MVEGYRAILSSDTAMRINSGCPVVMACFDVNRTILVHMALIRREVCGVVDEYLFALDVQKRSAICGLQVGSGKDLGRRARRYDSTRQQQDMVSNTRLCQVVCAYDDRPTFLLFAVNYGIDRLGRWQVETRKGFIEQQHVVILRQALGYEHALALTARKLCEVSGRKIRNRHSLHGRIDDHAIRLAEPPQLSDA